MTRRDPYKQVLDAVAWTAVPSPTIKEIRQGHAVIAGGLLTGTAGVLVLTWGFSPYFGLLLIAVFTMFDPRGLLVTHRSQRERWNLANGDEDVLPEHVTARTIQRAQGGDAGVRFLAQAFEGRPDSEILRGDALRRLGGPSSRQELERRAQDLRLPTPVRAAAVAGACSWGDASAITFAVRMLEDSEVPVRQSAAGALEWLGSPRATQALEARIAVAGWAERVDLRRALKRVRARGHGTSGVVEA